MPPWSRAGLPGSGRTVGVGPPLSWSGPSSGLIGAAGVPIWLPLTPSVSPVGFGWSADQVVGAGRVEHPGYVVGRVVRRDLVLGVERALAVAGQNGVEQADRAGAAVDE